MQNQRKLNGRLYLNLISCFVNKSSNMVTLPREGTPLSQLETVKPQIQEVYVIIAGYTQVSDFTGKNRFSPKHVFALNPAGDMPHYFFFFLKYILKGRISHLITGIIFYYPITEVLSRSNFAPIRE